MADVPGTAMRSASSPLRKKIRSDNRVFSEQTRRSTFRASVVRKFAELARRPGFCRNLDSTLPANLAEASGDQPQSRL